MPQTNPPQNRPGFRWEWRDGCDCENCPWRGNCKGQTRPHWIEIPDFSSRGKSTAFPSGQAGWAVLGFPGYRKEGA